VARRRLRALLLSYYNDNGKLIYTGRVSVRRSAAPLGASRP